MLGRNGYTEEKCKILLSFQSSEGEKLDRFYYAALLLLCYCAPSITTKTVMPLPTTKKKLFRHPADL